MSSLNTYILLVEDNRAHAKLVMLELNKHESVTVEHVLDGVEALECLKTEGTFSGRARPDLVLLDLKLPKLDGFDVLRIAKNDPELRSIPIVVLTTSAEGRDRRLAYDLHANSFLVKPLDFGQFGQLIADIKLYWCDWNLKAAQVVD